MKKFFLIGLLSLFFASCEDEIEVDLDQGTNQLVVDGFVNNNNQIQTIRLTTSANYFLNAPTPAVDNATVTIYGPNNIIYQFSSDNKGNFIYDPATLGPLDSTLFSYQLEIKYEGKTYTAESTLQPVPPIDSITSSYENDPSFFGEVGYFTQFHATDFPGREDWYWIKAYKNGVPINEDPTSLLFSKDAGFMGAEADGLPFIVPIRASITNGSDPFQLGDTSKVKLLSLNREVYDFLQQAVIQANNGGLFSTPPANIKSNIKDALGNSQNEVLGVFSMSSIEENQIIITQ